MQYDLKQYFKQVDGFVFFSYLEIWNNGCYFQYVVFKFILVKVFLVSEERERIEVQGQRFIFK